jgi:hypothetical protein
MYEDPQQFALHNLLVQLSPIATLGLDLNELVNTKTLTAQKNESKYNMKTEFENQKP